MSAAPGIIGGGVSAEPRFRDLMMDLGPYLYYPMDEDTGSLSTIEEIVQGQNVTGGPFNSWGEPLVAGDSASAVFADGRALATSGTLSTNITDFSYMAILKPTNVSEFGYAVDADNWWNWDIRPGVVVPSTYNIVDYNTHSAPISVGERALVIVTFSDSANRVYFYKNGSQVSTSYESRVFSQRSAVVRLGNRISGSNGYSGSLSHVAYFERVLTPTEISDLWAAAGESSGGDPGGGDPGPSPYNYRGTWDPGAISYAVNDVVLYNGYYRVCAIAHQLFMGQPTPDQYPQGWSILNNYTPP